MDLNLNELISNWKQRGGGEFGRYSEITLTIIILPTINLSEEHKCCELRSLKAALACLSAKDIFGDNPSRLRSADIHCQQTEGQTLGIIIPSKTCVLNGELWKEKLEKIIRSCEEIDFTQKPQLDLDFVDVSLSLAQHEELSQSALPDSLDKADVATIGKFCELS